MEPSVAPGAAELADLYSVIPFNVTFPDDVMGFVPDGRNYTEQNPVRSPAGMIIAISITALYSVICVVGLLGNILVMYGVVRLVELPEEHLATSSTPTSLVGSYKGVGSGESEPAGMSTITGWTGADWSQSGQFVLV
ncbi:hypothetical protein NFI96_002729 [Prochilodus magdalenae]|nr:hypothetical protein NFI96_002729 [Prochilodus magdalenae]